MVVVKNFGGWGVFWPKNLIFGQKIMENHDFSNFNSKTLQFDVKATFLL